MQAEHPNAAFLEALAARSIGLFILPSNIQDAQSKRRVVAQPFMKKRPIFAPA
jgi:hypothetical protein